MGHPWDILGIFIDIHGTSMGYLVDIIIFVG
jgi:hypothetical protein